MAINSNLNKTTVALLDGGSGGASATYGSYVAGTQPTATPLSAGTNTASGATGTGAATEQKAYAGAWAGSEPIDSYEEFLRNKESAYGSMRDQQTQFYDEQSQKALAAIEAQRQAALA